MNIRNVFFPLPIKDQNHYCMTELFRVLTFCCDENYHDHVCLCTRIVPDSSLYGARPPS